MSKISELTDGGSLLPTDFLIAVRSGGNVKVQADDITVDQINLGDNEFIRLGNSQDLTMVHTSTQSIINQAGIGDLLIQKAGATKLTINASGIDVAGTVTASAGITATTGTFSSGQAILTVSSSTTSAGNAAEIKLIHAGNNTYEIKGGSDLIFSSDDGANERVRITNAGNVGIGTNDLNGLKTVIKGSTGYPATTGTAQTGVLRLSGGTGLYNVLDMGVNESTDSSWIQSTRANSLGTYDSLLLNPNGGNVGIGTSPSGYRLQVASGANSATAYFSSTATPAYNPVAYNGATARLSFVGGNATGATTGINFSHGGSVENYFGAVQEAGGAGAFVWQGYNGSVYAERMRLEASGNLLAGKSATAFNTNGVELRANGAVWGTVTGQGAASFNIKGTDGVIADFYKDGAVVGAIGTYSGDLWIGQGNTGLLFNDGGDVLRPANASGGNRDGNYDLGASDSRFKDLYRSGSTISTSDRNMKQDERDLTVAEATVAQACKSLLKAFRFIDAVEKDGDGARIHFGIVAQDLQAAFEAEGLDATDYAMFRPSTYTDENGNEQTRLGVCYENLLAFIIAAI